MHFQVQVQLEILENVYLKIFRYREISSTFKENLAVLSKFFKYT